MSLKAKMLENIVRGIEHHGDSCPMPPNKVLLNPGNYELFGWDQIKGVPVEPSDQVPPERFRIDCDGSANGIEEAMEQFMPAPQEVPQVVPVGPSGPFETPFRPSVDDLDDLPIDPFRW